MEKDTNVKKFFYLCTNAQADNKYIFNNTMKNSGENTLITGTPLLPKEVKEHKFELSDLFKSDVLVRSGLYKIYDVRY